MKPYLNVGPLMWKRGRSYPNVFFSGIMALITVVIGYAFILLGSQFNLVTLLLPFSYLILGFLIKYGDQAYDEGLFSRRKALLLAFPSGILLGSLMALDSGTATIAIGLLFSLLLAGKYDNYGFVAGFIISISISIVAILHGLGSPHMGGILLVGAASYIDEWADDRAEGWANMFACLLRQRPFLKIMVLALCITGILDSYLYFFIFLSFDFGYSFMGELSQMVVKPVA